MRVIAVIFQACLTCYKLLKQNWGKLNGETTRVGVEKLIPFAFQTSHLTAILEKLSHRTAPLCEIPKGYDNSNK